MRAKSKNSKRAASVNSSSDSFFIQINLKGTDEST